MVKIIDTRSGKETDIANMVSACAEERTDYYGDYTSDNSAKIEALCNMLQFMLELLPEDKQIKFINKFSYIYKAE
jgi:hypothetical protein